MSAVLLTRLRITDLTAWTALHTGQRLLPPGHELRRVVREELLLFLPDEGAGAEAFEDGLLHAIGDSNFFVNPNKESYRFLRSRERGESLAPPPSAWGILTCALGDTRDGGLRARLLREHPLPGLGAIRRGRIWWLWTRGPKGGPEVGACYEALGPVRGTARGLLTNPHAESARLIETGGIPWKELEEHLMAAPEPAEPPVAAAGGAS